MGLCVILQHSINRVAQDTVPTQPPSPSWAKQASYSLKSSNIDFQEKLWEYLLSACKCRQQPVSTGEMVVRPAPPSPRYRRRTRESGQHSPEEAVKEKRDPDKNTAWINYKAQPDAGERNAAKPREQCGSAVAEASWAAAQKACLGALRPFQSLQTWPAFQPDAWCQHINQVCPHLRLCLGGCRLEAKANPSWKKRRPKVAEPWTSYIGKEAAQSYSTI